LPAPSSGDCKKLQFAPESLTHMHEAASMLTARLYKRSMA